MSYKESNVKQSSFGSSTFNRAGVCLYRCYSMRFVFAHVLLILLVGRGIAGIAPTRQVQSSHNNPVRTLTSRTLEVGPAPKSENHQSSLSHPGSGLSSSGHHASTEKHPTAPVPPQGPVPVTHGVTGSAPNQSAINSDHVQKELPHAQVASADASGPTTNTATTDTSKQGTDSIAAALGPNACDAGGDCASLSEAIISAAEGPECRALHITGKCTAKCLSALKETLAHKLWDACSAKCEIDVVTGAANRWAELCEARQPTLLDASKEALTIVAAAPGAGRAVQLFIVFGVLLTALALGYRKGLLQSIPLRLHKRLKRRSSERSLV